MQKKSSPQSRNINISEREFLSWSKEQPSIVSGAYGVEVHHCVGSSTKTYVGVKRVHIGHWFCIPLTTQEHWLFHNRKSEFESLYGSQSELWLKHVEIYPVEIPLEIIQAIASYGK